MTTEELIKEIEETVQYEHVTGGRTDFLKKIASRLRELHEATQWRPIEEAPKDETRVIGLVCPGAWPDGDHFVVQWNPTLKKWGDDHAVYHPVNYFRPYHPASLPSPPQKEGEE